MQRTGLREIRERTYKQRDAWWTVLLVDPLASRLVWLVAPYRRITPNLLTAIATVLGLASAGCFLLGDTRGLILGAILFHLSFVVDCMDGKIARLHGTGSVFGGWFDFMFDRVKVIICAAALFGGQYSRTGDAVYLWLAAGVVSADLFRYLNGSQLVKIRNVMGAQLAEARGEVLVAGTADVSLEDAAAGEGGTPVAPVADDPRQAPHVRLRNFLNRHRIRLHLVSGIEFEMAVFIIGPLTGWVLGTTLVAGALLLLMEAALIGRMWLSTRRFNVQLAAARAAMPPAQRQSPEVSETLTPLRG